MEWSIATVGIPKQVTIEKIVFYFAQTHYKRKHLFWADLLPKKKKIVRSDFQIIWNVSSQWRCQGRARASKCSASKNSHFQPFCLPRLKLNSPSWLMSGMYKLAPSRYSFASCTPYHIESPGTRHRLLISQRNVSPQRFITIVVGRYRLLVNWIQCPVHTEHVMFFVFLWDVTVDNLVITSIKMIKTLTTWPFVEEYIITRQQHSRCDRVTTIWYACWPIRRKRHYILYYMPKYDTVMRVKIQSANLQIYERSHYYCTCLSKVSVEYCSRLRDKPKTNVGSYLTCSPTHFSTKSFLVCLKILLCHVYGGRRLRETRFFYVYKSP